MAGLFNLPNITLKSSQGFVYGSNVTVQGTILSSTVNITESVNPPGTIIYVATSTAPHRVH